MTPACKNLRRKDPKAARLCELVLNELSLPPSELGKKECRIDYSKNGALPVCKGPDSTLEPASIYQLFLRTTIGKKNAPRSHALFAKIFGTKVPWQPNEKSAVVLDDAIEKIRREMASVKEDRTYLIAKAILKTLKTPEDKGGLGIKYSDHLQKEADIDTIIARRFVRCSEFQIIFLYMAASLGLKVYPVQNPQVDDEGYDAPHSSMVIIDEATGEQFFAEHQLEDISEEPPYEEYYIGTEADLFASFLYNRSMTKEGPFMKIGKEENSPLKLAEELAPHNDVIQFGLGVYYMQRREDKNAKKHFKLAYQLRPTHTPAIKQYCLISPGEDICKKILEQAK